MPTPTIFEGINPRGTQTLIPCKDVSAFPRSEQAVLGAKNGFNYDAWKSVTIFNGTGVFENNGVTLTATAADAYTSHSPAGGYPANAIMKVNTGDKISIVWDIDSNDPAGLVYLFKYQGNTSKGNINVSAITKRIDYTVEENVDSITIRFGVTDNGNTIHYKNIMYILQSDTDLTYAPYAMTNKELTEVAGVVSNLDMSKGISSSGAYTDLNNVKTSGIYAVFGSALNKPADVSTIINGTLIVTHKTSLDDVTQTLINGNEGTIYVRTYATKTGWSSWYKFTGTVVS